MVEVIHKGLGIKTECYWCGSVLKFQWTDMKLLNVKDKEYKLSPEDAKRTQYIQCPVCGGKKFVMDDSGWINGTKRIYEDTNKEEEE